MDRELPLLSEFSCRSKSNTQRILVVDDDPTVPKSCQPVPEPEGFNIYPVPSVDKALEAMRDDDFALLLVDIKIPKHDGIYLMREIKKEWPDVPIIVMSGYETEQTVQQAMQTGAAHFVSTAQELKLKAWRSKG